MKITGKSLVLVAFFVLLFPSNLTGDDNKEKGYIDFALRRQYILEIKNEENVEVDIKNNNVQEEDNNERPIIDDIPLKDDLLDYIYKLSEENEISYTYILAIAKTESNFKLDTYSKTHDIGLFQINKRNVNSFGEMAGLNNPDPYNPYDNTAMAVAYLQHLINYWSEKGYSEEDKFYLVTLSYNRGIAGAKKYIKKYGLSNSYVSKVFKNKEKIEGMICEDECI